MLLLLFWEGRRGERGIREGLGVRRAVAWSREVSGANDVASRFAKEMVGKVKRRRKASTRHVCWCAFRACRQHTGARTPHPSLFPTLPGPTIRGDWDDPPSESRLEQGSILKWFIPPGAQSDGRKCESEAQPSVTLYGKRWQGGAEEMGRRAREGKPYQAGGHVTLCAPVIVSPIFVCFWC